MKAAEACDDADDPERSTSVFQSHPVCLSGFFGLMYKHDPGLPHRETRHARAAIIELINSEEAFGPGRFTRAVARIREQGPHDRSLSFICADDGEDDRLCPDDAGAGRFGRGGICCDRSPSGRRTRTKVSAASSSGSPSKRPKRRGSVP